jgi:biuret amidohydrolase
VPIELRELIEPASTAVVAMELKRATVGDLATPDHPLAAAARERNLVETVSRVVRAARAAGVRVVHCTAGFRPDGAGSPANAPVLAYGRKHREHLLLGSDEAMPVPELGPEPEDLVSVRTHGVAPFVGTELDPMLRSLGVTTIVLVGNSLNVGIIGACIEAVDFGYRVVVPTDAVVGVPPEYGDLMTEHSLRLLARCTSADEIVDTWSSQ